jgi:DNA repair exonuclease SbcCD nuclease subunit
MNLTLNGKIVVVGDTHFGTKRFSIDALKDQLELFNNQIFPYMEQNNIKNIIQLGDLFDNRTTADINFMHELRVNFFDILVQKGFHLYVLTGNHDIFYRESRDVSLINFYHALYKDNFTLFNERTYIDINSNKTYIVPWIVKGEDLTFDEIKDCHSILGHFEIRHFAMVKGHMNEDAKLTTDFFTNNTAVKNVFSGHYHLKDTKGLVKYLGTPWQLNWSDYDTEKGFYIWDELDTLEFIPNTSSKKYIKIKYNDSKNTDKNVEVSGLFSSSVLYTDSEFEKLLPSLKKHEIKFFVNEAKDRHFDEILYMMKENKIQSSVVNNQELSEIVGTDYIADNENAEADKDTRTLIIDTVKENKEELLPKLLGLFQDIDTMIKEV